MSVERQLQMVGGNKQSGCKPREGQGGLVDGVAECSVAWSAMSLLKIVPQYLTFAVHLPVG